MGNEEKTDYVQTTFSNYFGEEKKTGVVIQLDITGKKRNMKWMFSYAPDHREFNQSLDPL